MITTRIQVQDFITKSAKGGKVFHYPNFVSGLIGIVKNEGLRALTRGLSMRLWFKVPASGAIMTFYEYIKKKSQT